MFVCLCPSVDISQVFSRLGGPATAHEWGVWLPRATHFLSAQSLSVFPRGLVLWLGPVYRASSCGAIYSPLFSPLRLLDTPACMGATNPVSSAAVLLPADRGWAGWLEGFSFVLTLHSHSRSPDGSHLDLFSSSYPCSASVKLAQGQQTGHSPGSEAE